MTNSLQFNSIKLINDLLNTEQACREALISLEQEIENYGTNAVLEDISLEEALTNLSLNSNCVYIASVNLVLQNGLPAPLSVFDDTPNPSFQEAQLLFNQNEELFLVLQSLLRQHQVEKKKWWKFW